MDKNLKINQDARDRVVSGINKLADMVKVTMGPKGQLVIIEDLESGFPIVTKDGVTVSENVDLTDQYESLGVRLVQQGAKKLLEEVGDSTTTTTVLAQALIKEGFASGKSAQDLQDNYTKDFNTISKELLKLSRKAKKTELEKVATISANGDKEVGKLVAKAFNLVGQNGNVIVEDLYKNEMSLDIQEGFKVESGFMAPHFITDRKLKEVHLEKPLVFISDSDISHMQDILPAIEYSLENNKMILFICPSMTDDVLGQLIYNRHHGRFHGCVIRLPEQGPRRDDLLEDLVFVTGAQGIMNRENDFDLDNFGELDKVVIKGTETFLSIKNSINVEGLIKELLNTESLDPIWIKKRISNLIARVATLKVGGVSDGERKERRDRVDDAVGAVRSSFLNGVIPGGGTTLHYLSHLDLSPEFKEAIKAPFKTILSNAGMVVPDSFELSFNEGYNVRSGEFLLDLKSEGILDSTFSVLKALEVAVSISKTVLQTGGLILTRN